MIRLFFLEQPLDSEQTTIDVPQQAAGVRLDLFLAGRFDGGFSRSAMQRLIEDGDILVDGKKVRSSLKLAGNEVLNVRFPPPLPVTPLPEHIPLSVIYEDQYLIVIDKPAGMVVHPGAGINSGTLVNGLLAHCNDLSGISGELRPGIVHRLDKGTSGLLVVAKSDQAHRGLAEQFEKHSIKRVYNALIYGVPRDDTGKFQGIIGRHPTERLRMSGLARHGRNAVTHWRVLERYQQTALVRLRLETGRTHQIRVHLSEGGMPLLGDPLYPDGGRFNNLKDSRLKGMITRLGRQALHAATLGFIHPLTGQYLEFTTRPPEDFSSVLRYLQGGEHNPDGSDIET